MEKKVRKIVEGPIRNKERTKEKLVATVGKIFAEYSYADLTISKVSEVSNLNPKLIYLYFGGLDGLVHTFLETKITAFDLSNQIGTAMLDKPKKILSEDVVFLLEKKFEELISDKEWQGMLHWSVVAKDKVLRKAIEDQQEKWLLVLNALRDNKRANQDTLDELAILMAGIQFLSVRLRTEEIPFFGLDLNDAESQSRIKTSLERLVRF
ncbi:TetR/AcrR family transcriptional regulator [Sphingobacterium sp. LRF_L2]|uniref:TetR/AcrR family transcriptional regulator n=1 Tax=Sphingobacterium sp. LRF_L2 TaxID=3369421 RepID=UPI003F5FC292